MMSLTPKIVNGSHEDLTIPFVDDREEQEQVTRTRKVGHQDTGQFIRRNSRSLPNGLNKLELEHLQRIVAINERGETGSVSKLIK